MIERRLVDSHGRTFLQLAMKNMPPSTYALVTREDIWKRYCDMVHLKLNQLELHLIVTDKLVTHDDHAAFKKMTLRFIEDMAVQFANKTLKIYGERSAGRVNVAE